VSTRPLPLGAPPAYGQLWPNPTRAFFFRNAIATGEQYPCETAANLRAIFKTGDEAEIRLNREELVHVKSGKVFKLKSLGAVMPVVSTGGLFAYARKTGMITTQAG